MVAPAPMRCLVLLTTLLLCSMVLAGCHDLPNTFSDNPIDPVDDPQEGPSGEDDGGDAENENDTEDNGEGEGEGGDDGGGDGGDDEGDDGGEDGDDGDDGQDEEDDGGTEDENGTDEEDVPIVEEGDFEEDHVVNIETVVGLAGCAEDEFEPQTLNIEVGEVVRWSNNANCGHTATSGDEYGEHDDLFDTGNIGAGEESESSYRFNEAGTYKYYCNFHPNMELADIVVS